MTLTMDSTTVYIPIDSPPTPAPSPSPSTQAGRSPTSILIPPLILPQNPNLRRQYLLTLLNACTPTELLFISSTIAPLLKRDFLHALPVELALHVLGFVDEPRSLVRAGRVSRWWKRLAEDETVWRRLCGVYGFLFEDEGRMDAAAAAAVDGVVSFREHFKYEYSILKNWQSGGHLLRAHRVSQDGSVVTSLALDDDWVVVGLANCKIHVFSARTGVLARTLVGHESGVWAVCLVHKGGGEDVQKRTRKKKKGDDGQSPGEVEMHQFLPPSLRVAVGLSAEENGDEDEYEYGNGDIPRIPSSPSGSSQGWGQPGALVVSGGCDKSVRVWDIRSGYCIYTLRGHTSTIRCIKVLHGRPLAVSGSRDCTLRVWDIQRGRLLRTLGGHTASVRCLDVCGNRVVSGSYDFTCRLWDVDTGECLHILRGHLHQIYSVAFDGYRIASGGLDTTVRVWDAETGECKATLQGHTALVCQLQLSPTMLATGGSDGRVIMFELPPARFPVPSRQPNSSSSPSLLSSASASFTSLSLSSPSSSSYKTLHRLAAHDSSVTSLQFDPRFLVTAGNDGRVRLYETRTGRYVRELGGGGGYVYNFSHGAHGGIGVGAGGGGGGGGGGAVGGGVIGIGNGIGNVNGNVNGNGNGGGTESVWKVAYGGTSRGGGREVCAIMCRRKGKTVMEIWSFRPEEEVGSGIGTGEGEGWAEGEGEGVGLLS